MTTRDRATGSRIHSQSMSTTPAVDIVMAAVPTPGISDSVTLVQHSLQTTLWVSSQTQANHTKRNTAAMTAVVRTVWRRHGRWRGSHEDWLGTAPSTHWSYHLSRPAPRQTDSEPTVHRSVQRRQGLPWQPTTWCYPQDSWLTSTHTHTHTHRPHVRHSPHTGLTSNHLGLLHDVPSGHRLTVLINY